MDGPAHLIACAHGLAGTPEDLRALERRVAADGNALVHRLACNAPLNSFDGVEAGAVRIVEELREVVRANPSLRYLTLYGNSLGGIYARYAAGIMWEEKRDGTMLGLIPCTYLTTATPHLGVGPWGFFKLVPRALRYLWSKQLGRSIMELTLRDGEDGKLPLLARMADPETREPANFVAALGSFKRRCAYANATNDFLVSYETASLHPEYLDSAQERAWRCLDEPQIVEEFERDGEFAIEETESASWSTDELALRRKMARGLRTLSWRHVNVSFPGPVPLAHNKICALQRNPYLASLFKEGEFIVDHQAEYLLASIRSV
ncbi:putative serine esterase-domain-containing protein [Ostreococcus tauri]|uniref:Putative serine esterase-domain-containing protein n=1 Tax=Ostreococcus tauri TaxID=70448 RepID=A0A1Y5I906_OSTTA|nr:putative serine esterase-domain-containing protein [Ostreococcus tauri]